MSLPTRRSFLIAAAAPALLRGAAMTPKQASMPRSEICRRTARRSRLWHHFRPGEAGRGGNTLKRFSPSTAITVRPGQGDERLPVSQAGGAWYDLKPVESPFPTIESLEMIRDGLKQDGKNAAYFVETLFNPGTSREVELAGRGATPAQRAAAETAGRVAGHLQVRDQPRQGRSEARRGGHFPSRCQRQEGILTRDEYARFSEPFDKLILHAVAEAPLNILHLHGDKVYVDYFAQATGWKISGLNYSFHETGYSLRGRGKLARHPRRAGGGIDHRDYRTVTSRSARGHPAGRYRCRARLIVTPGLLGAQRFNTGRVAPAGPGDRRFSEMNRPFCHIYGEVPRPGTNRMRGTRCCPRWPSVLYPSCRPWPRGVCSRRQLQDYVNAFRAV